MGLGFWGQGWMRILADTPGIELVGVVDADAATRTWAAEEGAIVPTAVFESIDGALEVLSDCTAVVVTVPPTAHAEVASAAIAAGLHCLIEKPLAPTMAEARSLVAEAAARGVTVMVGQNYRFKRAALTMNWLLRTACAVGRIERVAITFNKAPQFSGFRLAMEEPLLVDMAIHHFDLARFVLGVEAESVSATAHNPSWSEFAGNACAHVLMRCTSGAVVTYDGSWCARGPQTTWDGTWRVEGEAGCVLWSGDSIVFYPTGIGDAVYFPGGVEVADGGVKIPLRPLPIEREERRGTLDEFVSAVATNRMPIASGADNLRTLAIVFEAVESARAAGEPRAVRDPGP